MGSLGDKDHGDPITEVPPVPGPFLASSCGQRVQANLKDRGYTLVDQMNDVSWKDGKWAYFASKGRSTEAVL